MTPHPTKPVPRHARRGPCPRGGRRIRVVEVLATGTNGGAQEHLFGLVTRIDPTRYDVSIVALSPGSAVRKLQRAGFDVLVIDEPDDAIAVGALAAHLAEVRADVVHNHMYRAETRRHAGGHRPGRDRPSAAVRRVDRPLEPRSGPTRIARCCASSRRGWTS